MTNEPTTCRLCGEALRFDATLPAAWVGQESGRALCSSSSFIGGFHTPTIDATGHESVRFHHADTDQLIDRIEGQSTITVNSVVQLRDGNRYWVIRIINTDADYSIAYVLPSGTHPSERVKPVTDELINDLTTLQGRIDAALKIHRARKSGIFRHGACVACSFSFDVQYPCATAVALGVTSEQLDAAR